MSEIEIFAMVLPILAPVLVGWLAVRSGILAAADAKALTTAYLYLFLPALIVDDLSRQNVAALFDLRFMLANLFLLLAIYLAIFLIHRFLLRRSLASSTLAAFACAKFNAVVVGLPLLLIAIGRPAIVVVVLNLVVGYFTILPLTLFLLEVAREQTDGPRRYARVLGHSLRHVAVDPLIVATVTGLLLAMLRVTLPNWLHASLAGLGGAAVPVPLVAVGMTISGAVFHEEPGEVLWVSMVRVIASPLAAIGVARIFGLSPLLSIALVISFGLPTAKMAFALAEKHGVYTRQMAAIVTLTTLSMAFLFPGIISLCQHLWPGVMLPGR